MTLAPIAANPLVAPATVGHPLAENNFGDTVPGGLAGPLGLLIIVLLGIATVLLVRNMNTRLRRLPASFDDPGRAPAPGSGAGAAVPSGDGDPPAATGTSGAGGPASGGESGVGGGPPADRPQRTDGRAEPDRT